MAARFTNRERSTATINERNDTESNAQPSRSHGEEEFLGALAPGHALVGDEWFRDLRAATAEGADAAFIAAGSAC